MEIYFILLGWSFFTGFVFYGINKFSVNDKVLKIIYCCINYIPLAIVLGIRDKTVGTDTGMYHNIFLDVARNEFNWSFLDSNFVEIGYRIINKVISFFILDDNIAVMLIAFITIGGFAVFFYKNSYNIWLTTFLFIGFSYYLETFNTMRQVLACMIICNAFIVLKNKKNIYWIISVLIASTIHFSSVIFLVFTKVLPLNKKKLIVYILPIILLYFCIDIFSEYFILLDVVGDKYKGYFLDENILMNLNDILKILLFFSFIGWGYYKRFLFSEDEKNFFSICSIFLIYAIICIVMKSKMPVFYRFVQYFSIYFCILCPFILEKTRWIKYVFFIGIILTIPIILEIFLSKNPDFMYSIFF